MVEIIITAIVLWIWILTLHKTITHIKKVNEATFQTIIANQLATEWAEIIYQIRNSNFLRYESDKEIFVENCINTWYINNNGEIDEWNYASTPCSWNRMKCYDPCLDKFKKNNNINRCRLALNYETCINNPSYTWILNTWFYYIKTDDWKNSIIECTWNYDSMDRESCLNNTDKCCYKFRDEYSICLNSWVRVPCTEWHEIWLDESKYWKLYRNIEWIWIYDITTYDITWWTLINFNNTSETTGQEFRFCSTVTRPWWEDFAVEICSTMTNFIE